MQAQVIAIGNFSHQLVPFLNYPARYYESTREGAVIPEIVFWIADCFGIDPWDFNQHELNPHAANTEKLAQLVDDKELACFTALRAAGFRFFFLPNG